MNAANRPIDFLINTDSTRVNQTQRRDVNRESVLSASKLSQNSFDDVYRKQQRDEADARRFEHTARLNESQSRAKNSADARDHQAQSAKHSTLDMRSQKEPANPISGKPLPSRQEASSAADSNKADEVAKDLDTQTRNVDQQPATETSSQQQDASITVDDAATLVSSESDAADALPGEEQRVVNLAEQTQQAKLAVAETTQGQKQKSVGNAQDSSIKHTGNLAANKGSADQLAQAQLQERLSAMPATQDFKLLREQLAAANLNAASEITLTSDASSATDSAADRLPRLNALTQSAQALAGGRPGTVTASVPVPVHSSEWGQAMSQRITWLVNRGISAAELQLNPGDLGPVDVRINISGDQASVQFTSQHGAVREALESSVVKLREMMESSGLNLVDVNVSDQSHSEQAKSDSNGSAGGAATSENGELDEGSQTQTVQVIESDGLVDFYA